MPTIKIPQKKILKNKKEEEKQKRQ